MFQKAWLTVKAADTFYKVHTALHIKHPLEDKGLEVLEGTCPGDSFSEMPALG